MKIKATLKYKFTPIQLSHNISLHPEDDEESDIAAGDIRIQYGKGILLYLLKLTVRLSWEA